MHSLLLIEHVSLYIYTYVIDKMQFKQERVRLYKYGNTLYGRNKEKRNIILQNISNLNCRLYCN